MKLATVRYRDRALWGSVTETGFLDLTERSGIPTLRQAIGRWRSLVKDYAADAGDIPLEEVSFEPPIPDSGKVLCVGLNYKSHQEETGLEAPEKPTIFQRYPDAQVGHLVNLKMPSVTHRFDFEGELAFVIGKTCHEVKADTAMEYVAGYSVFNDGSVRDWQFHTSQFLPGKNFLASGSFGPWIVTADSVQDVRALHLTTRLNGATMQDAGLEELIFSVPELIEYISTFTRLVPGDVVSTGTPAGIGAVRKPRVWLKPGDRLEFEISGIGVLRNQVA